MTDKQNRVNKTRISFNAPEFYNKDSGAAIELGGAGGNKKGASIGPPTLRGGKGISNG